MRLTSSCKNWLNFNHYKAIETGFSSTFKTFFVLTLCKNQQLIDLWSFLCSKFQTTLKIFASKHVLYTNHYQYLKITKTIQQTKLSNTPELSPDIETFVQAQFE